MVSLPTVTRVGGATAKPMDPCQGASMPNVIGKTVRELKRSTVMIGNRSFDSISLVLSDGSKVMAAAFKPGQGVGDPGIFVVVDPKECIFAVA